MASSAGPRSARRRPDVTGTKAAENLARADRIPSPIVGPQYAMDEAGIQYIGFVYITPIPIWNSGGPLLRQRQAEHHRAHLALEQARQRARGPGPLGPGQVERGLRADQGDRRD